MRVLVSNDDGVDAPGIRALAAGLREAGHEVMVVAPDRDRSGASNSLTLDVPLRLKRIDPHTCSIAGTPADCVHLALTGRGRERVLVSLQLLAQAGKLAEVRLLMVPGRSDFLDATGALEEALTTFLLSLGPVPIRLNSFRHHGVRGEALSWPEAGSADLTVLANALKAKGFGSVMLPAI